MPQGVSSRRARRPRASHTSRNTDRRTAAVGDVTLGHFANRAGKIGGGSGGGGGGSGGGGGARMKKESLTTAIKKLSVKDSDERPWDEQDDDDDDDDNTIICNGDGGGGDGGGGGEGGREKRVLAVKRDHKRRRRRRRVLEKTEEEEGQAMDYPLDLWFCISEYIRPEDIGRFACLCQATRYITTTVQFWLSMFRRHYQWTAHLPDSLNYWNLDRRMRDVRVCVVRALFLMYPPYRTRLAAEKPLSADPTQLLRAQCILQWHRKEGSHHKYFFKFAHPQQDMREGRLGRCVGEAAAHTNPHSGCWVLEATSVGVCAVPMVMGEYLYHAGVGVSANLCSHTLRLSLVPPHLLPPSSRASRPHRVPATEMTLDPVSNVRLFPWWHPEYWNLLQVSHTTEKDDW